MNGNEKSNGIAWLVGYRLSPAEVKLVEKRRTAIQYYQENPAELSALRVSLSKLKNSGIYVRIDKAPEAVITALELLDGGIAPFSSANRSVACILILEVRAIIEEASGK